MSSHPYATLTPERVMDAVESLGYLCDARILALNSYDTPNVYICTRNP